MHATSEDGARKESDRWKKRGEKKNGRRKEEGGLKGRRKRASEVRNEPTSLTALTILIIRLIYLNAPGVHTHLYIKHAARISRQLR